MTKTRIPFGSIVKMTKTFTDYRQGLNKTNINYSEGQIVPVDSWLLFTINSYIENNSAEVIPGVEWEGYESDYALKAFEFNEYSLFKFRFKNQGSSILLPNIDPDYELASKESIFINDGITSVSIKYADGSYYPNLIIEPKSSFKVLYIDDASDKGRWIFIPLLYREDSSLESTPGSPSVSFGSDTTVLEGSYEAFENLSNGDFVAYINDSGALKIRKALANSMSTKAIGFVKSSYNQGTQVKVFVSGLNSISSLTVDQDYFLSSTHPGQIQLTPPSASSSIIQKLGSSISDSDFKVIIEDAYYII